MSKDVLKEKLSGINAIRKELALRFALFSHTKQADHRLEMLADIHKIDQELTSVRKAVQGITEDPTAEEQCLSRIRHLEDQRFQLLSELNGENVSAYTVS